MVEIMFIICMDKIDHAMLRMHDIYIYTMTYHDNHNIIKILLKYDKIYVV